MNTKKMASSIIAAIMVIAIFAAMVGPAAAIQYNIGKHTLTGPGGDVDNTLKYYEGETAYYRMVFAPTDEGCTLSSVEDLFPDATTEDLLDGTVHLNTGQEMSWETSWVVNDAGIKGDPPAITNYLVISGIGDASGEFDATAPKKSYILYGVVFDFNYEGTGCMEITFTPVDVGGTFERYKWIIDGTNYGWQSGEPQPQAHTFSNCYGLKTVTLIGESPSGETETVTKNVPVLCPPDAVATVDPACVENPGDDATFTSASTAGGSSIVSETWVFSDDQYAGDDSVTRPIPAEGVTGTLTVMDAAGCIRKDAVTIAPCSGCSIRLYGTFGEGAGNHSVIDDETGLKPENPPYTCPEGPFFPQHPQAPVKDFMTFNPAIMDHNQAPPGSEDEYDELDFYLCCDGDHVERPQEKVFKRMWYQKEWFKDKNKNGCWDVVVEDPFDYLGPGDLETICLHEWNAIPEWHKVKYNLRIIEWNDPEGEHSTGDAARRDADIYAPAIIQEFTYMTLDEFRMPIMVENGSKILVPMAHDPAIPSRGLNSFDADNNGNRDALKVESEATVGIDIDQDGGALEHMNPDGIPLSNDETVVLVLENKYMTEGATLQFFDHNITLNEVFSFPDAALFDVCDNEGGNPTCTTDITILEGNHVLFYRGRTGTGAGTTFYLKLIQADAGGNKVMIEVGRMFGQAGANIGDNTYWNQKAFMVDGVFYSIAAIMTGPAGTIDGDCFKYMTVRQKLPKFPIKIYGKHLEVWKPNVDVLPEMAPFCLPHEIIVDVLDSQDIPQNQYDKVGEKVPSPPLVITYVDEDIEPRFKGSLLEILDENWLHLELREKDPDNDWRIVEDGAWGRMAYTSAGPCFGYCFKGDGLIPDEAYSLIYYADFDPRFDVWGGNNPGALIGTGVANADGKLEMSDCPNLGMDLPCEPDWNINPDPDYCDYHNGFDDYDHCCGAKIWLVPSENYSAAENKVTDWEPDMFLFETDLITYKEIGEWPDDERWNVEWFHTYPEQYTEFKMPAGQKYLVTLAWTAPEAETTIWDGDSDEPIETKSGDRFKFWFEDCSGPLYIDEDTESIRIYGTFGEGAGDHSVIDNETGLRPENPPYTCPEGPFFPQHPQAPVKDFMTFNPAIMDHNQAPPGSDDTYDELDFFLCSDGDHVERPQEKVFKRMWYAKEWFKDQNKNGDWDVVIEDLDTGKLYTWTLDEWNAYPEWKKVRDNLRIIEWNDPEGEHFKGDAARKDADIYGPAIIQEFTYMTLDEYRMPIMVEAGSKILVPMAHDPAIPFRGLNSFDADNDTKRDALRVESEATLDLDIDQDGTKEHMNPDGVPLSNDETVVLVLGNKYMTEGATLQFFDHVVELHEVWSSPDAAIFSVCDNEGSEPYCAEDFIQLVEGETVLFYRGRVQTGAGTTFYLKLIQADAGDEKALIEVGRMFGQADANIGDNTYWNQKAFIVDEIFYSIAAIMTGPICEDDGDCFKYMTIRQKLPKFPIKIHLKHLEVWENNTVLPEMAPFCLPHEIIVDVLDSQDIPQNQYEKIGEKVGRPPLEITYVDEDIEPRFKGSLLEILNETKCTCPPGYTCQSINPDGCMCVNDSDSTDTRSCECPAGCNCENIGGECRCIFDDDRDVEDERWIVEWFHTYPEQYTSFVLPEGDLYLMTLAWYAPEANTTIWDGCPSAPIETLCKSGDRAKFWHDPTDLTDIYINRIDVGAAAPDLIITDVTCGDNEIGYTVKNDGGANAGAQTVGLYVGATLVGTDSAPALAPSVSHTGTIAYTYNGEVDVEVCADKDDVVAESDETNNCMSKTCGGLCGDVNCKDGVTMGDVILLRNHVGHPTDPTYDLCNDWAGDVNCKDGVTMGDVILLRNHVGHPTDPTYDLHCCNNG